ncbi:MAG: sugar phosphate isomerase/epimerase family protein [Endomicrobiales bacterium]
MQLLLTLSVLVAAIMVLILWVWHYRLYRSTGLVLAAAFAAGPRASEIPAREGESQLHIGISTGLFYDKDILEVLPVIKEAGYQFIEIWAGPQKSGEYVHFDWHDPYRIQALSACLKAMGIKVHSLHAPFSDALDISHTSELKRRFAVNEILRTLEVLKSLGGEYLVIHPASNEHSMRDKNAHFRQSRKSIEEIHSCLEDLGLKMAVENQLPHILGGDAPTLLALIEGLSESRVGVCFDTSHANLNGHPGLDDYLQQLAGRLMTLHISDNYGKYDDHFLLGDGHINWPSFITALHRNSFQGIFMLEITAGVHQHDKQIVLQSGYQRARQLLVTA